MSSPDEPGRPRPAPRAAPAARKLAGPGIPPPRRDPDDPSLPPKTRKRLQRRQRGRLRWGGEIRGWRHRLHAWLNMLFVDHAVFRAIHLNRHRVGAHAWRAAQPLPWQIARMARDGVRTVVTLRGGVIFGSFPLEREACARHGLNFERFVLRSRDLPKPEEIAELETLIARLERPVLFHCKSGADRAGFMAALWLILAEGRPVAEARSQLSLRYGHFRSGPTGVLDLFFDRAAEAESRGVHFRDWVKTEYDRAALTRDFKASGAGAFITDRLLGRE